MAEVTVADPQTVVEEKTVYECDRCGVRSEEPMNEQRLTHVDGPLRNTEEGHLCDECVEADRYSTLVDLRDTKERFANLVSISVSGAFYLASFVVGAGLTFSIYTMLHSPKVVDEGLSAGDFFVFLMLTALTSGVYFFVMILADALVDDFTEHDSFFRRNS